MGDLATAGNPYSLSSPQSALSHSVHLLLSLHNYSTDYKLLVDRSGFRGEGIMIPQFPGYKNPGDMSRIPMQTAECHYSNLSIEIKESMLIQLGSQQPQGVVCKHVALHYGWIYDWGLFLQSLCFFSPVLLNHRPLWPWPVHFTLFGNVWDNIWWSLIDGLLTLFHDFCHASCWLQWTVNHFRFGVSILGGLCINGWLSKKVHGTCLRVGCLVRQARLRTKLG